MTSGLTPPALFLQAATAVRDRLHNDQSPYTPFTAIPLHTLAMIGIGTFGIVEVTLKVALSALLFLPYTYCKNPQSPFKKFYIQHISLFHNDLDPFIKCLRGVAIVYSLAIFSYFRVDLYEASPNFSATEEALSFLYRIHKKCEEGNLISEEDFKCWHDLLRREPNIEECFKRAVAIPNFHFAKTLIDAAMSPLTGSHKLYSSLDNLLQLGLRYALTDEAFEKAKKLMNLSKTLGNPHCLSRKLREALFEGKDLEHVQSLLAQGNSWELLKANFIYAMLSPNRELFSFFLEALEDYKINHRLWNEDKVELYKLLAEASLTAVAAGQEQRVLDILQSEVFFRRNSPDLSEFLDGLFNILDSGNFSKKTHSLLKLLSIVESQPHLSKISYFFSICLHRYFHSTSPVHQKIKEDYLSCAAHIYLWLRNNYKKFRHREDVELALSVERNTSKDNPFTNALLSIIPVTLFQQTTAMAAPYQVLQDPAHRDLFFKRVMEVSSQIAWHRRKAALGIT